MLTNLKNLDYGNIKAADYNTVNDYYDIKVTGITEELMDKNIVFCIYVTLFGNLLEQVRLTSFVGLIVLTGFLVN